MAKEIIEISGLDYSGKSTQAEMLTFETWAQHVHNFGSFHGYGEGMPGIDDPRSLFRWWFEDSSPEEFTDALTSAYCDREFQAEQASGLDVAVVERGLLLVKAQVAANFATRCDIGIEEVYQWADETVDAKVGINTNASKTEVILLADERWKQSLQDKSFNRVNSDRSWFSSDQNEFYALYLKNLGDALAMFSHESDAVTISVDGPAVDVQNTIRKHEEIQSLRLPPLLPHEPLVLGFTGMSECGKSAIADNLAQNHSFTRLKLGYFNETRRPIDASYADPAKVALDAVRFIATNRHIARLTLESIHSPSLSGKLKEMLGDMWKTVYIELSDAARAERLKQQYPEVDSVELLEQQYKKDMTKRDSGVERHRDIADIVVDNSGPIEETVKDIIKRTARHYGV